MSDTKKKKALPVFAIVPKQGKCDVAEYHGRGYFTVVTKNNKRLYLHRSSMSFTNK